MADGTLLTLRDSVEQAIAQSGEAIVNRVTSHYVDTEIDRRAKLLIAGVEAVRQAEADLKKVNRPNIVHYNEDGSIASQHYDKATLSLIKKGRERVEKLTGALNTVLANHTNDTYKKLDETIKKSGKGGSRDDEESED